MHVCMIRVRVAFYMHGEGSYYYSLKPILAIIYHELAIKSVFSAFYKETTRRLMCKSIKNNMNIIKFVQHKQALLQQ